MFDSVCTPTAGGASTGGTPGYHGDQGRYHGLRPAGQGEKLEFGCYHWPCGLLSRLRV